MIDKNELRRHNILLYTPNGNYIEVESIGEYWINAAGGNEGEYYAKLAGIPITEDILLKCGFEQVDAQYSTTLKMFKKDLLYFELFKDKIVWSGLDRHAGHDERLDIKFLHELQNIYYWLSGKKELEVKL